eukprot:CAMPEP_0116934350 /NCGR_PEP_ID=MMETSP0467-20121206/29591_1 /TAXON_ID=283647 /ORGANISM="Mesodinium pulex, Strain SPMC105" /LENGTH=132 /DNA_ID=CAMNT_0004615427 /DNA_START=354 /DNA_END=749 /DNA_ORIENTATION=+
MQILTSQLANLDRDNASVSSDDESYSPNKKDTLKAFRNTFKNLVNKDKDPKAKGSNKDEFSTKITALRNLLIKKKSERLLYEQECLNADKFFYGIDCERNVQAALEIYEKLHSNGNMRAKFTLASLMIEGKW